MAEIRPLTWAERIEVHLRATGLPRALFVAEDGRAVGTWVGETEELSDDELMRRTFSLFPDCPRQAILFDPEDDLASGLPLDAYDIVFVAPGFPVESPNRYQPPALRRRTVIRVLADGLQRGARVAWLDQTLPMYRKEEWAIEAAIGVVRSPNDTVKALAVFRRL